MPCSLKSINIANHYITLWNNFLYHYNKNTVQDYKNDLNNNSPVKECMLVKTVRMQKVTSKLKRPFENENTSSL